MLSERCRCGKEKGHTRLSARISAGAVTDRATATRESGRDVYGSVLASQDHVRSGEPGTVGMSANDSYTRIGLDTECRVLTCQQVCWCLTCVHRATGGRRTVAPADAMPSHILPYRMPEPCTGWTDRRVCFREIGGDGRLNDARSERGYATGRWIVPILATFRSRKP